MDGTASTDDKTTDANASIRHLPLSSEGRDYLTAASAAASRTRKVTVTLVALSVVMFIGMLNSLAHSWAGARLLASRDSHGSYVINNIGPPPDVKLAKRDPDTYKRALDAHEERYRQFYAALMRSYVETGFAVRVPFFGVAIDVNDIGFIGGLAFIIVLAMFDFSLRREHANVESAFDYARRADEVRSLYDVLAMHQLFTVPRRHAAAERGIVPWLPKLICLLPLIVQAAVVGHDVITNAVGVELDPPHNTILLVLEIAWLVPMVFLTTRVVVQMVQIDRSWDKWADVRFGVVASSPSGLVTA